MKALLVVANPNPCSLTHALAEAARSALLGRGYDVSFHDLYAEGFNPVQPAGEFDNVSSVDPLVEQYCAELEQADFAVVSHPNWWGQPPAILKGWVDRVFRLGTAYGYPPGVPPEGEPVGLLKVRTAVVLNTSNTPAEREAHVFGDPLDALWKRCVFGLCGVSRVERRMFGPVSGSTAEQRHTWLAEARGMVERVA
ncbi:MAG: NAD(P)H-dependent oxidoreductase [Luteimonas sp.]|nr:NAD(P)H-dependent oxidoreductase [Luteimonas sp.]